MHGENDKNATSANEENTTRDEQSDAEKEMGGAGPRAELAGGRHLHRRRRLSVPVADDRRTDLARRRDAVKAHDEGPVHTCSPALRHRGDDV
ncbi:hypothetical protein HMPREF0321_2836 [Dermacoccus sp. Ellin185]|nr:hypothetical protein HMPREF0321_2836 [Dermacoccus sp. Ellin185]